jgi:hypothetical protein
LWVEDAVLVHDEAALDAAEAFLDEGRAGLSQRLNVAGLAMAAAFSALNCAT